MSTSFIGSTERGTTSIDDFVADITRRFDRNADGDLSSAEFTVFLKQFLGSLGTPPTTGLPSAPGAAAAGAPDSARVACGTMAGFDDRKLADPTHLSFKYQVGRILQFYPNTATGLRDALAEIQQLVPGARMAGDDKIDFGDYIDPVAGRIGVIDVIQGVHGPRGGEAWQWAPVE